MCALIVTGGSVVREDGLLDADVAIRGETIEAVEPRIGVQPGAEVIDARGLWVLPGLIDPHVHLGLPAKGTRSADDVASGTVAALHGGVTSVIDFTLQRPGESPAGSLRARRAEFDGHAACDYALHLNVTDFPADFDARIVDDLRDAARLGAASLKVFTAYGKEGMRIAPDRLRSVLAAARATGFLPLVHAEDDAMVAGAQRRLLDAGRAGAASFAESRPAEAEARAIRDVVALAREAGSPVYFVHVSTAAGAQAIRDGRARNAWPVHFETCPHYLALDRDAYARADGVHYLVAPPLRSPEDRASLLSALASGEIDVVATDHCAFRREQKARPGTPVFDLPNGLPGVETRLPLLHTLGVAQGRMTPQAMVRVTAANPARIFGLAPRKGTIAPGADADLVLFDPRARWTCTAAGLHMATDFSPYEGMELQGRVRRVLLRGRTVVEDGRTLVRDAGRWLPRRAG